MAFGAVLTHNEQDRASAYLRLSDYVPLTLDPESSDFLYQINLPVQSQTGIEGLRINRLSKWGATMSNTIAIVSGAARVVATPVFAIRLELDINTAPEIGAIPQERRIEIFRELVQLGQEIADRGIANR